MAADYTGKMKNQSAKKPIKFIRKRCPHLKGKELLEAEERFRDYLRIVLEIHDRLEREKKEKQQNFDKNTKGKYNQKRNLNQ